MLDVHHSKSRMLDVLGDSILRRCIGLVRGRVFGTGIKCVSLHNTVLGLLTVVHSRQLLGTMVDVQRMIGDGCKSGFKSEMYSVSG